MSEKYIRDFSTNENPALSGYTIYEDGVTTSKVYFDKLKTLLTNESLNGSNFIMVYGKGTPEENAEELQEAYNAAKNMTPSDLNRITLVVAPGKYRFGNNAFEHNTAYIDIVSLTGEADVFISSDERNMGNTYGIKVTANNSKVKGINCGTRIFSIAGNLDNLVCDTCIGGDYSFGSYGGTISGTFKDCIGGNASFGSYSSIALGTFINCTGGNDSFGTNASGKFKNCTGGNDSFGGGNGTITAEARLYNCRLTSGTFNTPQSGGQIINCIDGNGLVNYPNVKSPTFIGDVDMSGATSVTAHNPTFTGVVSVPSSESEGSLHAVNFQKLRSYVPAGEESYLEKYLYKDSDGFNTWQAITAATIGLGNVTNESKATMFTNPTFTGVVSVPSSESELSLHAVNFQKLRSYVPAGEESYLEKYLYKDSDGFNTWQAITAATIGLGNVTNESKATMFTNPTFTGTVTAPTPTSTDNSTKVATTAFVNSLLNGTNYIMVYGKGTPTENAIELQAVYNAAKTMSPLASNRVTVIVAPGKYDFGATAFVHDTQYIDIVSLTGEADVFISSDEIFYGDTYGINVTADNSKVKGINCESRTFFIVDNLDNLVCDTCIGGNYSFGGFTGTASGTFINCTGSHGSFGGYSGTASGTFINCTGGNGSFGGYSGTITAEARLYNCRLTIGTFEIPQLGGQIINCITGDGELVNNPELPAIIALQDAVAFANDMLDGIDYDIQYGLSIMTTGQIYVQVDAGKVALMKMPDGTVYQSNSSGIIDENYVGTPGDVILATQKGTTTFKLSNGIGDFVYYIGGTVTIPNSVTAIGNSAFYCCYELTTIDIPNSVTSIGSGAFSSCYALTSITIPNSVTSIGDYAFSHCTSLTSITIPDSVTTIGNNVFDSCSTLATVTIGNSVTSIGSSAFSMCSALTTINIPDSVTSIGGYAFNSCSTLATVTIGNSVTSIGSSAFSMCSALTTINIPDSVTSIGDYAFDGCEALTSITIPDSVETIGDGAFAGCSLLTTVNMYRLNAPTVSADTFDDNAATLHIKQTGTSGYTIEPWITPAKFVQPISNDL